MTKLNLNVILRNGVEVPILGLGTTHNGGYVHDTVVYAIKECGYRHIDTAKRYGVEAFLAKAIEDSNVDRAELFLSTKLWPKDYGRATTQKAAHESMSRLKTDYLDLYMLHWPYCPSSVINPKACIADTWRELELLYDAEKLRSIGVSNFQISDLEDLMDSMETSGILPHVNQCEFHPFQNPRALRTFCEENDIAFEGYCPLGKGRLLTESPILKIAQDLGKSPAQVMIRWSIQNGVIAIPKSTKKERVLENFQALNFQLPAYAMKLLDELHSDFRVIDISDFQPKLDQDLPDGYKIQKFPCIFPDIEQ